jgi:hypothetical protein
MINAVNRKILVVAPNISSDSLLFYSSQVKHVSNKLDVFPAIYQWNPDVLVFDTDFMGSDMEKVLRRIKGNRFYDKITVCVYKAKKDENLDSMLIILGVDQVVYTGLISTVFENIKIYFKRLIL